MFKADRTSPGQTPAVPTDLLPGRLLPRRLDVSIAPSDVERVSGPTRMLLAISATGKHLYQGTVPAAVVAKRRAKNKAARIARRAAR